VPPGMSLGSVDVDRLQRDLEAIVGPRRMSMRTVDLDTYARDMWPRLLLSYREGAIDVPRPHVVVWPEHVREIVSIVKLARERGIPIVPYGGGSGVCGGAVPLHGGITIDTKRMQQLRSVHSDELNLRRRGRPQRRAVRARARAPRLHVRPLPVVDLLLHGRWLARDPRRRSAFRRSTQVEDRVAGLTVVTAAAT